MLSLNSIYGTVNTDNLTLKLKEIMLRKHLICLLNTIIAIASIVSLNQAWNVATYLYKY